MVLLMLFALVAGAATALSPCVLPVLPALLGAGRHRRAPPPGGHRPRPGGHLHGDDRRPGQRHRRRRPRAGADADAGRRRAHRLRHRRGVPGSAARLEAPLARLSRLGPRTRGDGFGSGLLVGAALGFVYAPCAGPILAAVIAVGAASSRRCPSASPSRWARRVVLLALSLGGRASRGACAPRRAARPSSARWPSCWSLPAWRWRRTSTCASRRRSPTTCPPSLVNPTHGLERSHAVASAARRPARPVALRGRGDRAPGAEARAPAAPGRRPRLHRQPALVQHARRPAADAWPVLRGRSCSSTSGPTPASTACARCPTSRPGTRATARRPDDRRRALARVPLRARRRQRAGAIRARGSAIRSRRTTTSAPGTRRATSTGRPST